MGRRRDEEGREWGGVKERRETYLELVLVVRDDDLVLGVDVEEWFDEAPRHREGPRGIDNDELVQPLGVVVLCYPC